MNIFKIFHKKTKEINSEPKVWGRQAKGQPKSSISAKVTRKDGSVEDLGILAGGK